MEPQKVPAGALAAFLDRWQWVAVALLCGLALWIRAAPRFDFVFQDGFVNFQESDAWYHVRVAENLIRHFPWRIAVDPYVSFGHVQDTATAPFYDWLLGFMAWVLGAGSPSDAFLHVIAAWYPVVLAMLTVVVVFVLAKRLFGLRAALVAAAVIATLPGHFLRVSSLGFTDHHIMESLLATLFFLLLLRALDRPRALLPAILAGVTLSAYLLTFHGAAFLVGVVVIWAVYDRTRSFWPRAEKGPSFQPLYIAFLIALGICLVFRDLLWMNYTIRALALGAIAIAALDLFARWCSRLQHPRRPLFVVLAGGAVLFLAVVVSRGFGLRHVVKAFLARLVPALFGNAGGVNELQPLIFDNGHLTLVPVLLQFYGAFFLALLGLFWLGETSIRRGNAGRSLIFFWGLITGVMAMGQLRITYYFAIAVALLSGYAAASLFATGRKTAWAIGACLACFVFGPNLYAAATADKPNGMPGDWREALDWLRQSTPDPFRDPAFYYARYSRQQHGPDYQYPPSAYSVMAWWDYGYWLVNMGRRIPVTNPTQANAADAADFFLAQSESDALARLHQWRSRYVIVDDKLPLLSPPKDERMDGAFPSFFAYSRVHRFDEYLLVAYQPDANGKLTPALFYRPAYYRSMAVRLFLFGGQAETGEEGSVIVWLREKALSGGRRYQEVVRTARFGSPQQALAEEAACRSDGCVLVGDNPLISCVPVEALEQLHSVFSSSTSIIGSYPNARKQVQIYEVAAGAQP